MNTSEESSCTKQGVWSTFLSFQIFFIMIKKIAVMIKKKPNPEQFTNNWKHLLHAFPVNRTWFIFIYILPNLKFKIKNLWNMFYISTILCVSKIQLKLNWCPCKRRITGDSWNIFAKCRYYWLCYNTQYNNCWSWFLYMKKQTFLNKHYPLNDLVFQLT